MLLLLLGRGRRRGRHGGLAPLLLLLLELGLADDVPQTGRRVASRLLPQPLPAG